MQHPLLARFSQLVPLPVAAQEAVEVAFVRRTCHRGTCLVQPGEVANYAYFIESGTLRVYTTVGEVDSTLYLGIDGDFVVALSSFLQRTPSQDAIHCLDDTTLYAVHYDRLNALYDQFPELDRIGRLLMERYALQIREHGFSLRFHNTQQRYETLLHQRPQLVQRVPLIHIASYLGMTAQALSMARGRVAKGEMRNAKGEI
jgi:CRP/FNR family transcriptional regulator, anaerobic regulatory protein